MRLVPISSLLLAGLLIACAGSETEPNEQPTAAPEGSTAPGPVGAGDPLVPWAGNPGYDVIRYDWRLSVDPSSGELSGTAVLTATALENLDSISLDYAGPTPEAVFVDGVKVEFDYSSPKLELPADIEAGNGFTVEALLNGTPASGSGFGWIHRGDLVYTVALLPGDTASWVPLNDTPKDPAVFSVMVDAGAGSVAVASGTPATSNGETTWETPMAVSEFGMAVGDFEQRRVVSVSRPQITMWTPAGPVPPNEEAIDDQIGGMLSYLESFLGPFPFPTLGVTKVDGLPGANSTPGQIFLGVFGRLTVAHELAHQWIGGSVGTESSRDSWLREGLPEYLAVSWVAEQEEVSPEGRLRSMYERIAPSTRAPRDVDDPGDRSDDAIFVRGPLAVYALHVALGDESFRAGLAQLTAEYEGRSISTENFIDVMQAQTEVDVSAVMSPWIDDEELPPFP